MFAKRSILYNVNCYYKRFVKFKMSMFQKLLKFGSDLIMLVWNIVCTAEANRNVLIYVTSGRYASDTLVWRDVFPVLH